MEEDPNQERKQKFLREKILEKGVDTGKFVDFLKSKKGEEEGADIGSWTMEEIKQVNNDNNNTNQNNNENDKKLESVNKTDDLDKNKNETKPKEKKPEKEESIKFIIDEDSLLDFMLGFKGIKKKNKGDEYKNSDIPKSSPLSSNNTQKNNKFDNSNNQQFNFQNNFNQNINNSIGNNSNNNEKFNFEQNFNKNNNNNVNNQQFNFDKNFSNNQNLKDNNSHEFNFEKNLNVNKNTDNKPQFNFDEKFKDNNSNLKQKQSENNMDKNEKFNPNENKRDDPINNNIKDKEIKANDSSINNSMDSSNDKNNNNSPNNISKNNLTNMIDKNDHDSEYGITIPEITKCKKIETTEFSSHKDIVIKLSDPIKVETRFFTGKSVNYLVTTAPFNYAVHRKYSDFLWLRDTLTNIFNTNLIPKITKKGKVTTDKHDDLFIQKRMKILEKFINFLLKDELIKSSKIFYDFLTLQKDEDFQHVKKGYDK